jgi:hypothetical protein
MEETVAAEREKLELKIAELETAPLDFFGSQRNKTLTIGYYRYRLEDLAKDPEKYFASRPNLKAISKSPPMTRRSPSPTGLHHLNRDLTGYTKAACISDHLRCKIISY